MDPQTGAFGQHEVLHTASILLANWSDFIQDHGATTSDPELATAAREAAEKISDFYQLCGRKFLAP